MKKGRKPPMIKQKLK